MTYIPTGGTISSDNSTTTPLASGATYTGTWEYVASYPSAVLAVLTDQEGTAYMDFSPDGTNLDSTLTYKVAANINDVHRLTVTRGYYRVRFTNDSASAQTSFRLQTIYGQQTALAAPVNLGIQQDADATIVRPTNYNYEVALSKWTANTTWNKWGYNSDIDTAATEVVASFGGTFTWLTSAETLDVVSSSANDDGDPAGTGANTIIIYGIDANREYQIEVVTLNGTTTVTTSNTWLGVNRVSVYASGSGNVNEGTISITATTSLTNQAEIPAGEGSTQQCIFFTQADHTALMDWLLLNINKISGGGSPSVTVKAWVYSFVSGSKYEVYRHVIDTAVENTVELKPTQPFVVGEKSVFWIEASTNTNNTIVSARFSLIEVRTAGQ